MKNKTRRRDRILAITVFCLGLILFLFAPTLAQETEDASEKYFSNTELLDQNGRKLRLYQEILKSKTVVIYSFFSTCTGSCPVINVTIRKIQQAFSEYTGNDLLLVGITVDSETDTPEILKQYAGRFKAGPGWLFLTGEKSNVDYTLNKFGLSAETKEAHKNILIIGNLRTGLWKKAFGLASAEELIPIVESVLKDEPID